MRFIELTMIRDAGPILLSVQKILAIAIVAHPEDWAAFCTQVQADGGVSYWVTETPAEIVAMLSGVILCASESRTERPSRAEISEPQTIVGANKTKE